ncbi:MAG TPA: hypothetical protein VN285_00640 [Candidatus Deferrimicrobium sp.]|nr:hypothetical protein [Candidatus Deferrimicrobium sp.]
MSATLGSITARLAQPTEEVITPDLVDLINRNIKPPKPIDGTDLYIAAMYVVSDEVNSFGGRFPNEEHERLAQLLVDSPVLVGHRKDTLPIGRNFHAAVVDQGGKGWVKSYFYWLKSAIGAEELRKNIDGGIYKECSIGFTFLLPECSICGKDIRTCPHEPFQKYAVSRSGNEIDQSTVAHFNYRQIVRVLETSLVYRGAVEGTKVTRELAETDTENGAPGIDANSEGAAAVNLSELDPEREYLIVPYYEALPVLVTCINGVLQLSRCTGETIDATICSRFPAQRAPNVEGAYAHLVAYRGRERCSVDLLERHLSGRPGEVTRLELKLFPPPGLGVAKGRLHATSHRIRLIRHHIGRGDEINRLAPRIMTRRGVRIWPVHANPAKTTGFVYCPPVSSSSTEGNYELLTSANNAGGYLKLHDGTGDTRVFVLCQFNLARLLKGARFMADRVENETAVMEGRNRQAYKGRINSVRASDDGLVMELSGTLPGTYVLQPVTLDGRRRYLFYRRAI